MVHTVSVRKNKNISSDYSSLEKQVIDTLFNISKAAVFSYNKKAKKYYKL